MKAAMFAVSCLGSNAMRLMRQKEEIKPVQDEAMMGLNLVNTKQAHKTLNQIKEASAHTKIEPHINTAEQGLNFVQYHLENDQKNLQKAVDYQVHKVQDAVDY